MAIQERAYGTGRRRLLDAAREEFAEKGFRGATTRDIAERAGVTEPMVFRHFGSKAALFEEAAVAPVVEFIDSYVEEWGAREQGVTDPTSEAHDFFSRLHEVLVADRELLIAIQAAGEFDEAMAAIAARLEQAFLRVVEMFEQMIETEFTLRRVHRPDRPALARVMLGMVISIAIHDRWLAIGPGRRRVSPDRVLAEAARTMVEGLGL